MKPPERPLRKAVHGVPSFRHPLPPLFARLFLCLLVFVFVGLFYYHLHRGVGRQLDKSLSGYRKPCPPPMGLQDMPGVDKGRTGLGQAASAPAWPLGPVPGRFRLAGLWKDFHHLERHPNSPMVTYSDPLTQPTCVYFKLPHPAAAQRPDF